MSRGLLAVEPGLPLTEVAQRMVARDVGAVLVLEGERLVGILTERDVLRAVAGRVHSSEATVREWMTPGPITATEETTAEEAAQIMLANDFRHIPVVEGERAIGVVSIRDVLSHTVDLGAEPGAGRGVS
jgi:CBS domain-containing protein